ncbi:hypothetical protein [Luteimonas kalidii]|uniref:DUF454 family protein n=1 Tax=Luteimonas kalidii TaxID=3042025 RepID=A0ABT6JUR0_9GAMM|nr:hypothetical protein [Luteimonas kalidii]MDH5834314.1 hypothetical protein [Luteimonas kalidii]
MSRPIDHDPTRTASLRTVEQLLAGAVFIGAVAAISLPGLDGALALWLPLLPLASLVTARMLSWRRAATAARPAVVIALRRRTATAMARRRPPARRPAARLLAAIALR